MFLLVYYKRGRGPVYYDLIPVGGGSGSPQHLEDSILGW